MDSYVPLLEKIRIPQPSLQKLAVISIFQKFRSTAPSDAGRDAVSHCLRSASPAVVDQSTREFCRLVKDAKLDIPTGLLELQSALEDSSNPQFTNVFIKTIGFLTRLGFQENPASFRFYSSENHPFVKILSCGAEVQGELVKQVIIFITKGKHLGMEAVCDFLGPFLSYSIIKAPISSSGSTFVRNLVSTMAALCCSFPQEAIPIIKLLTERLKFFSCKNAEEVTNVSYIFECLVDAYQVVLRQLVGMGLLVHEARLCGFALLEAILSQNRNFRKCSCGVEKILDAARHLLAVQKELGLNYSANLSSVMLSLFEILTQSDLEHEQYTTLKLVLFLLRWKYENEYSIGASVSESVEELLFIFPVLALVSSPSRSIKQTATDLLSVLGKIATNLLNATEEKQVVEGKQLPITTPGYIVSRFLRNMWFEDQLSSRGLCYVNHFSDRDIYANEDHCELKTWTSSVREYCIRLVGKHKDTSAISQSKEIFPTEMPQILCAVASIFLLHRTRNVSIDLLATCSNIEPMLDVPLLLIILFYNHICSSAEKYNDFHDMRLKLLGLLPSVASHPAMIPLTLQILRPMLHKDVNPVIKAAAIRLMCKTWEINGRVFESLQASFFFYVVYFLHRCPWSFEIEHIYPPGMLHPNGLVQYGAERGICISIAVSIQDVCKRNPDRGVDIILSVAACIENHDPLVQSLGLQSLAHLCEADAIDFYTAWDVIAKHIQNYSGNAIVAYGLSVLLRWGAMDAEAYPEAAKDVTNILWNIGTHREVSKSSLWARAREAAFTALLQYDVGVLVAFTASLGVVHIQSSIPDFSTRNMEFLISQANPDLQTALEEFEVKIINYEHITRRRFVKQKRISGSGSKIVKLLDVVPGVIFSSGTNHRIKELPGAALLCFPTYKDVKNQGPSKDVHAKYEDAAVEVSTSLHLSRNIFLALVSLQSWKPFLQRWLSSCITALEANNVHGTVLDKTSKAANDILKILTRLAEEAIPRSAENIALAIGAFCLVLPASAHSVKPMASKFLLNWLSQYEHEYRQWSAAISLGLISSCLHVTDHDQKFKNINALLEVASISKSTLVKGACGVGLGFSCQDLLTRVDSGANTQFDKETYKMQETELLRKILRTLVQMIYQLGGSSAGILKKLNEYFPLGTDDSSLDEVEILSEEDIDHPEEDAWAVAGPIIGLGNSLGAIYRAGAYDAVRCLKDLIISWIPNANSLISNSASTLGACLALPTVVSFCLRVEMIDGIELDRLVRDFVDLVSELLSVKRSDTFYRSLLMASCAGAGSLLSIVLNAGLHSLEVEDVKGLLALFRRTYLSPYQPFVHLGGMLGVVNAMGAGAGTLIQHFPLRTVDSNHVVEAELTLLVQEIFLLAQNTDDSQSQHHAAWTVSFLRHFVFSRERANEEGDPGVTKSVSQGFAEDSIVMKLSAWLMQMNYSELGSSINITTVAFALRCLAHAPRLPSLDWGPVIRRCMKYGKGTLREDCFLFLLSHANQSDSLLGILDELFDLARFKTLESNLQSLMLSHLADLLKIFSTSRLVKLFDDVADFLHWLVSSDQYDREGQTSLRVSCWKGLELCLNESALDTQDYARNLEHCMEVLFTMLPWSHSGFNVNYIRRSPSWNGLKQLDVLGKARRSWLSDLLQALRFLGLLSGSSCKYMPFLVADKLSVLSDLPVTLSSLLVGTSWEIVAETVASYVWKSTERIHDWATHIERGDYSPGSQPIDRSENEITGFLLQVMHRTCVSLKEYLPTDKQLRLANMVVKED
ncbi:hypothetical protein DH2020_009464 [Rehmannia glutinosa]|uniref:DUF3730 domain-containing protein n=1 Tax=Rehmannia glutinosa TaxID=99300 RepID=A0ABR0X7P2_REHGL